MPKHPSPPRPAVLATCVIGLLCASALAEAPEHIVVGGDANYAPFEWHDGTAARGFHIDLFNALSGDSAVPVSYRLDSWPNTVRALEAGRVDVVPMFRSASREQRFRFTAPFHYINHAIYTSANAPGVADVNELRGQRIAVEELSYAHQRLRQQGIPAGLVLTDDTLSALRAVQDQRADYAVLADAAADHLLRQHRLAVRRTGPPLWPAGYAFAVHRDREDLAAWLDSRLQLTLASGRYEEVFQRWQERLVPTGDSGVDLVRVVSATAAPLGLLVALGLGWSWSLRRTVARRTSELSDELLRRREAEARARRLADYDETTALPKLHHFIELTHSVLAHTTNFGTIQREIAVIKLIELERIIHSFGYDAAHRLRVEFAERLRRMAFDTCGQLGRDGFVVFAERGHLAGCLPSITAQLDAGGLGLTPQVYVGTASWPMHGDDTADLVRRAETALASALQNQTPWCDFDASLEPDRADLQIVSDFRETAGLGLHASFQPQLSLWSGRLAGAEALARWHHPKHGALSPAQFIPLLENAGLISLVTGRMIDEAARVGAELRRAGHPCTISVNVAARDLVDGEVVETVSAALQRHGALAEDLKLELTESNMARHPEAVKRTLETLYRFGVRASVDDFGTGYSSLQYLSTLPISEVKIDRVFVRDMVTNDRNRSIVRSTIAMGHELGLQLVAEGAEDDDTVRMLRTYECDFVQGYAVSRPLSEGDFGAYVSSA